MPEGHLLHRTASELSADLARRVVAATSPQGRFDATPVDGCTLTRAEAYGKHLLVHLQDAPSVHVHLGMRGLFLRYPDPATPPRGGVRLRLAGPVAWDLIAPTTCELLDAAGVARVVGALGPDPLRDDASTELAVTRLRAARDRWPRRWSTRRSGRASATPGGPSCCSWRGWTRPGPRRRSRTSRHCGCGS